MTRLGEYLKEHRIKPAHVARLAGLSRQQLLRMRTREVNSRRETMLNIARACSKITGKRVRVEALFSL